MTATRSFELSVPDPPEPISGDIDGDLECADLDTLRSQWDQTYSGRSGDLDKDGIVDVTDMSILLSKWTAG